MVRFTPRPLGRLASLGVVAGSSGALAACGLVLGIDDIPAVHAAAEAGPREAATEAGREGGADAPLDVAPPDSGVDAPPVGEVPARSGSQTTSTAEVNFAVRQLWVGDTDTNSSFTTDPGAWATFGYNIDGKVTTSVSTDVCTLGPGASSTVQIDGHDGADNSFGENIVSFLSLAFTGLSLGLTQDIQQGNRTVILDSTGLSLDPAQTNVGLIGALYGGGQFKGTPTFTLADNWPIDPTSLADGRTLAGGPKVSLSDAYIVDGTFVSGHPTDLSFSLIVAGVPVALNIHQAVITFRHTVDDAGVSHAQSGVVSGVLKPSELFGSLQLGAAAMGGAFCSAVPVLGARIFASQDIMLDGTNAAGEACDGISVAFAFTADQIQPPKTVGAATLAEGGVPMCPSDGGVDGAASDAGGD